MKILGPISCVSCGRNVWWDRTETGPGMRRYRLMEGTEKHLCKDGDKRASERTSTRAQSAA